MNPSMTGAVVVLLALGAEPGPWKVIDSQDGITLSSRELPDERVTELRAQVFSPFSAETLCAAGYGRASLDKDEPDVTARTLIREGKNERVTYEQISTPIVSDRDYAVKMTREVLPNGGCRTRFVADNAEAPPLPKGYVRIEKLHGGWDFEPQDGGTACTYVIFTDPAGSIPAVFVEGPRRKTVFKWVHLVLARAASLQRGASAPRGERVNDEIRALGGDIDAGAKALSAQAADAGR